MSDEVSNKSIPGPIEVTDEVRSSILGDEIAIGLLTVIIPQVLYANAHPSVSHMSANFAAIFGESIRMTRYVRTSPDLKNPFVPTRNAFLSRMHIESERLSGRQLLSRFSSPDLGPSDGTRQALHIPPSSPSRSPRYNEC